MTQWTRRDKLVMCTERALHLPLSSEVLYPFPMATTDTPITNGVHYHDWDDRYHHVDQVLDRPGPRTDPDSFMAGDIVSDLVYIMFSVSYTRLSPVGQKLSSNGVQDPRHRRRWFGV